MAVVFDLLILLPASVFVCVTSRARDYGEGVLGCCEDYRRGRGTREWID